MHCKKKICSKEPIFTIRIHVSYITCVVVKVYAVYSGSDQVAVQLLTKWAFIVWITEVCGQ